LGIDTPASMGSIGLNDERIGVALQPGHEVSAIFLNASKHLVLVKTKIEAVLAVLPDSKEDALSLNEIAIAIGLSAEQEFLGAQSIVSMAIESWK
jgi:hypothetical protein